jgi:pyrroloquinoline quinone biosynthesis protein E
VIASQHNAFRPVLRRGVRYRWDPLRQQHQLLYPEGMLALNETAAAIVKLCDGRRLSGIHAELSRLFSDADVREEVDEFLSRFASRGWIRDAQHGHAPADTTHSPAVSAGNTHSPAVPPDNHHSPAVPAGSDASTRPFALVAELTYRCPLKCPYCSNPLELHRYGHELPTPVWRRVLTEAAGLGVIQVHFSGGEPLVRADLCELVETARSLDLYSNISTSAVLADAAALDNLKAAGLDALQISLLDTTANGNDWLAGTRSFDKKRRAVELAKERDFPLTLNVVLHRHNLDRIEQIIELAIQWRVDRLELAHVQYTGWAFHNRFTLLPTQEQVKRAEELVASARQRLAGQLEILHVLPDYFQQFPKACLQGWGRVFVTVAPDGAVLPCQTAREITGLEFPTVHTQSLDEIWFDAPVFRRFRGIDWLPEPCRSCDRREIDFGGCRCQAFLLAGDPALTDPVCHLSPLHHLVEGVRNQASTDPHAFAYRMVTGISENTTVSQPGSVPSGA